jgi:hypothetical protein
MKEILINLAFGIKRKLIPFDHRIAQRYELDAGKGWMDKNFTSQYNDSINAKKQLWNFSGEWFENQYAWERFIHWTNNSTMLEIGAGPIGTIVGWWWAGRRILIDPLILEYRDYQTSHFGATCYTTNLELIAQGAEEFIPKLESSIDGVVVCRNTLDHCRDPITILENISRYTKAGSYLLLWTDLYHPGGNDDGHTDITKDIQGFRNIISGLGFGIEYETPIKKDRNTLQFGCRARKVYGSNTTL